MRQDAFHGARCALVSRSPCCTLWSSRISSSTSRIFRKEAFCGIAETSCPLCGLSSAGKSDARTSTRASLASRLGVRHRALQGKCAGVAGSERVCVQPDTERVGIAEGHSRDAFGVVPNIRVPFSYPQYRCRNIGYNQKGPHVFENNSLHTPK